MNSPTKLSPSGEISIASKQHQIFPLWLKITYTLFMAVLIPVYWKHYGPLNFLYFCDAALIITAFALWTESKLLVSIPAVGIILPQLIWIIDFCFEATGHKLTGMTAYMFDHDRSAFLRGLSLFHGWLPILLAYMISRTGYDRRAFPIWTALAWMLCLISFFCIPSPGAHLSNPLAATNVNYVFGFDELKPQTWMAPAAFLIVWMLGLFAIVFTPTHFVLRKLCRAKI